jgi:hypothetical protein
MKTGDVLIGLSLLAASAAWLPGCELASCTDIGCGPALRVEFLGGASEAGEYEITVTADGVVTTCTATLPFASCETAVSCDRSDQGFWVMQSGCALDPSDQSLDGLEWTGSGPESLRVEVRRDGSLVGTADATPAYHTSHPNGPDCGPICQQSDQAVELSL